jgi:hypothetical protein
MNPMILSVIRHSQNTLESTILEVVTITRNAVPTGNRIYRLCYHTDMLWRSESKLCAACSRLKARILYFNVASNFHLGLQANELHRLDT